MFLLLLTDNVLTSPTESHKALQRTCQLLDYMTLFIYFIICFTQNSQKVRVLVFVIKSLGNLNGCLSYTVKKSVKFTVG